MRRKRRTRGLDWRTVQWGNTKGSDLPEVGTQARTSVWGTRPWHQVSFDETTEVKANPIVSSGRASQRLDQTKTYRHNDGATTYRLAALCARDNAAQTIDVVWIFWICQDSQKGNSIHMPSVCIVELYEHCSSRPQDGHLS